MSCPDINPAELSKVWGNSSTGYTWNLDLEMEGGTSTEALEANSWLRTHDLEGIYLTESILVRDFIFPKWDYI